jgi:hypothetical protein
MANLAALNASVLEFTLLKSSVVDGALARVITCAVAGRCDVKILFGVFVRM